ERIDRFESHRPSSNMRSKRLFEGVSSGWLGCPQIRGMLPLPRQPGPKPRSASVNRTGLLSLFAVASGIALFAGCSKDPPPAQQPQAYNGKYQYPPPGQPGQGGVPATPARRWLSTAAPRAAWTAARHTTRSAARRSAGSERERRISPYSWFTRFTAGRRWWSHG